MTGDGMASNRPGPRPAIGTRARFESESRTWSNRLRGATSQKALA